MTSPSTKAPRESTTQTDAVIDHHMMRIAQHVAKRAHLLKSPYLKSDQDKTFGQRAADTVANFGGSWAFIGLFALVLIIWVVLNSVILVKVGDAFDPYPYILLNLFLSMLASIQAPIILMSQNRQADKDRINAEHDYEVNLKAEMEIMYLHEKIDTLREQQFSELLAIQQEQIRLLNLLLENKLNK